MRATDQSGNGATKSFNYEYLNSENINDYKPLNLNISNYYGKNLITWDISKEDKTLGSISYNIYKGATENFTPSNDNLIAENIKSHFMQIWKLGKCILKYKLLLQVQQRKVKYQIQLMVKTYL